MGWFLAWHPQQLRPSTPSLADRWCRPVRTLARPTFTWSSLLAIDPDSNKMTAELRLCCYFLALFFWRVEGHFCRGFVEKRGADGGFLMVNLWWKAGERWLEDDVNFPALNMPLFLDLF